MEGASAHARQKYANEWSYTQALNLPLKCMLLQVRAHFPHADFLHIVKLDALRMVQSVCWRAEKAFNAWRHQGPHNKALPTELKELCGPEPGDLCVMSTKLDTGHIIWALGHRRGGEVHTFITLCGTTLPGKPQRHAEEQADGSRGPYRPYPRVLNDWTKVQPAIDDANRRLQNIIAFEKRFVTHSFRPLTTVIGSRIYINAYNIAQVLQHQRCGGGRE
eukprot:6213150-Pleurochrysis_carterae.AAC.2